METLRVVLITNNYTPYSGGVVSSITVLADGLQQRGHEVRIVTLDFLGGQKNDPDHVYRLLCPIRFTYKKNYMAVPWRSSYHVLHYLKNYKPDVVHVHHPFLLGVAGLKAAHALQCPVIFTYHTMYEEYYHYVPLFPTLAKPAIQQLVTSFCKRVDHIIAPSAYIKKSIQEHHIGTPVSVVPSAIQNCFVTQDPPLTKRAEKITLLSVGRFTPEKNIPFLLEVVKKLDKRFCLMLVGYGFEQEYLEWYAYGKLQLLKEQVSFVVNPPKKSLVQLYKQADLFLFASTTDTQGLVLAEAMASGAPVVALDGPGQRDIVEQGYNGYLVKSQEEMLDCIRAIIGDPDLNKQLQQGAWETSKRYWSTSFSDQLDRIYWSIKNQKRALHR